MSLLFWCLLSLILGIWIGQRIQISYLKKLVDTLESTSETLEALASENTRLRSRLGIGEDEHIN